MDLNELQQQLGVLLHAHRQRERLMAQKREIDREYKASKDAIIEILHRINRHVLTVDAPDGNSYKIALEEAKNTKSVRAPERDVFIENIVKQDLTPEELAQSLKDGLQGDVKYVDKLTVKKITNKKG